METLVEYACQHAQVAHWLIFLLLMLAGLNLPFSEDILVLSAGAIASMCVPEQALMIYAVVYAGCWLSAWEAYGIGRHFGPKLCEIHWFSRVLTPHRISRIAHYYAKFGILTFIVGRFIPGGVRNALFMTSGLIKMPFLTFIMRDGLACLLSSSTLFYLGFRVGENYRVIAGYLYDYNRVVLIGLILLGVGSLSYWRYSRKTP